MSAACELLGAYVDGELEADEAVRFADHLATCPACPAALHEALQLVGLEAAMRAAPVREVATPAVVRAQRRWSRAVPVVGLALAAAAVVALWLGLRRDPAPAPPGVAIAALPAQRATEGRVTTGPGAAHRPYSVARAADRAGEPVALGELAALEQRGDVRGLAAAYLRAGDPTRALAALAQAGAAPEVGAERGFALVLAGQPGEALVALDDALAQAPGLAAAQWNRALALRDLGLPLGAAAAFEAVAARGEPGWADEARARAAALRAEAATQRAAFDELVGRAGPQLAQAPGGVAPALARQFPGSARLLFYDAVRGATSADAVRALAPLAAVLDADAGSDHLARYLARIAEADFARRAPLAARYAAVVTAHLTGARLDPAGAAALQADLRRARQDDILLGALIRTSADGMTVPAAQLPELRRLATATADPWFALVADEQQGKALIARGDHDAAERVLRQALAGCRFEFRCARLELLLGRAYLELGRTAEARRVLAAAWARARRLGEHYLATHVLYALADLEQVSDDVGARTLANARAYAGELVARAPDDCRVATWSHELLAMMWVNRGDLARARAELGPLGACAAARPDAQALFTRAHVVREGGAPAEVAALRAAIATLRAASPPAVQALLDQTEGRLVIDGDRAAGRALLERAIATARGLPGDLNAVKARAYASAVLVLDAGRAAAWPEVWQRLADELGVPARATCTLGIAVEDRRGVVVVRDARGGEHGAYATDVEVARPAALVPAALREALAGCADVAVLARAPVHGRAGLLAPDVAWSYRARGVDGGGPSASGALVIADPEPPTELGLARLAPWSASRATQAGDRVVSGAAATPTRALAELAEAGYAELHVHGLVNASVSDASFLALSAEPDGRYALTAAAIRARPLRGRPVVVLAACRAAEVAPYAHQPWSLPAAFVAAGARAVIASPAAIDDAEAGEVFAQLRARLARGEPAARALRDVRVAWLAAHPGATWVGSLIVFN